PDFLTYRATGDETRSLCTTVCKWTYLGHEPPAVPGSVGRWEGTFFQQIGLGDLVEENYRRIGARVRPMGEPLGRGLTAAAASELGLRPGTAVGVGIIDAHAGGLGVLGAPLDGRAPGPADFNQRIALIGGTSSCHMAVSPQPRFVPGVWGPYYSAMVPGLCATEDDLAVLYLATVQAIAYGTRHILEALNAQGYGIDTILASGGGTKNPVFVREHSDVTGCRVVLPREPEAVLLGAAMLGAVASGDQP